MKVLFVIHWRKDALGKKGMKEGRKDSIYIHYLQGDVDLPSHGCFRIYRKWCGTNRVKNDLHMILVVLYSVVTHEGTDEGYPKKGSVLLAKARGGGKMKY